MRPTGVLHTCFLVGIAVQGTEIFQVQFDVASSTAACYYGLWLSLVLTGNPTPGQPSERGLHAEVAGGLVAEGAVTERLRHNLLLVVHPSV